MATVVEDVQADPTLRAVNRFSDESQWQIVRGRPVFTEHDEFEKDRQSPDYGKLKRRFGQEELETIAANCNARFQKTGDACPLTLGHTMPGKPEEEQPAICGYAINFRVGRFGPDQKLGILSDWYLFPELELHNGSGTGVLDQYPRCSVELYPKDEVFDPIALLRRTPELDMGLTVYQKQQTAALYQRLGREHRRRYIHKLHGPVIRYSMGDEAMTMPAAPAPAMPGADQADLFGRFYACSDDKVMSHFRKKYEASDGAEALAPPDLSLEQEEKFSKYGRYMAKHSRAYKKAAKKYQEETGEKLDDSEHFAADEMSDDEVKEASQFARKFAKSKLMKYALGEEEEVPLDPPADPAAPPVPPPVDPAAAPPPVDPAAGADDSEDYGMDEAGELPGIHANTADRYWKHFVRKGHIDRYMKQFMKKNYSAGAAGGSNTFTPSGDGAGSPVPGPADQFKKKDQPMTPNDPAAIQYARELQGVRKELAELKAENEKLKKESAERYQRERRATANVCVTQLEGEGFSFADRKPNENRRGQYVERFAKADDAQRLTMMQEIRDNWRQEGAPIGQPVGVAQEADPVVVQYQRDNGMGGGQQFGVKERDEALQYMKENKLPPEKWPEVVAKFTKKIA